MPLVPESRELTAFRTPTSLMHFRVLPFRAPPTFQRLMNPVLQDLGEFTAAYLDDAVTAGRCIFIILQQCFSELRMLV